MNSPARTRLDAKGFPVEDFLEKIADRLDEGEASKASDILCLTLHRRRGRVVDIRVDKGEDRVPLTKAGQRAHTPG